MATRRVTFSLFYTKFFQMETWKKMLLLLLTGCVGSLQAQVLVSSKSTAGKLPFGQEMPRLRQASELIKLAAIPPLRKPFVVALDPVAQLQAAKDQCPYLQDQEPTLYLEGERSTNTSVRLEWETTHGWNNQSFTIERSLGDSFHFETVNSVWAKAVAGIRDSYHQPDDNDFKKLSYYRIRLELRDGGSRYSNIALVNGYQVDQLKVFPNPTAGRVLLTLYSDQEGEAVIKTYDATGKLAIRQTVKLAEGYNSRELNVSNLTGGLYTVQVSMPDKAEKTVRFIRQ